MAEQQKKPQTQQDLNQLLKVRREKLAALQEAGKDPFEITKYDQTHHSDEVKELTQHMKRNFLLAELSLIQREWTKRKPVK